MGKGRVPYMMVENKKEIWLVYKYLHKQFEKRLSNGFLKKLIDIIFK